MSALPTRADLSGTPTRAELQTILLAMYDMVAQRLAAGTTGAGTASAAELLLARNSLGLGAGADIASAATLDLTARTGNVVRITGTTSTTTITMNNGDVVLAIAVGAWPIAVSGVLTYTCAAGDMVMFSQDNSGVQHAELVRADGMPRVTPPLRGHIDGLVMSTAGSSTTMTIAAGQAADSTNSALMTLGSSLAKTTSNWAVGAGGGKLSAAAIAANTWYYFFLIRRPDTGVVDVGFDVSPTSPTLPANYTQYRYIGAGYTNGSSQWTRFTQAGDEFWWYEPVRDFSGAGSTTAALLTCSVPSGRKMRAFFNIGIATGGQAVYINDPDNAATTGTSISVAPGVNQYDNAATMGDGGSCWTNTSGQIRHVENTTTNVYIITKGWIDLRGKDA